MKNTWQPPSPHEILKENVSIKTGNNPFSRLLNILNYPQLSSPREVSEMIARQEPIGKRRSRSE